jgi:L-arabonate dehydrase
MRDPKKLRSYQWFHGPEYENLGRRAWLRSEGFGKETLADRPIIGICNSWSELNNCNIHLRMSPPPSSAASGQAGGIPLEFPTISLGEMFMKPTTMLFRNLMAMDVEESIRANPIDGVVLLCGCDKTTPAQFMGAASADIPSIMVTGGPMLAGRWRDEELGSGTDGRRLFQEYRAGKIGEEQWAEIEGCIARSARPLHRHGHGLDDGLHVRGVGLQMTGGAAIPAVDARRYAFAEASGRAHRRNDLGGSAAVENPDARGVRERRPHGHGHRRLDQRRGPPARRSPGAWA